MAIDKSKRNKFDEVLEIKGDLTLEHIMPQKWEEHWPIVKQNGELMGTPSSIEDYELVAERKNRVQTFGNLTLLTQSLNGSVSNAAFAKKMPVGKSQGSIVLNRELSSYDTWDEKNIIKRAKQLFQTAKSIWPPPL